MNGPNLRGDGLTDLDSYRSATLSAELGVGVQTTKAFFASKR